MNTSSQISPEMDAVETLQNFGAGRPPAGPNRAADGFATGDATARPPGPPAVP